MKKTRLTEAQIVKTWKQVEGGRTVKELCSELGISEEAYFSQIFKAFGMEAHLEKLKELTEMNVQFNRMYEGLARRTPR